MAADQREQYRRAVADDGTGEALRALIAGIEKHGIEITGHDTLKTAPKGYPKDHPRVDLLRHKGLIAWQQWPVAAWLGTATAKKRVAEFLRNSRPLADWLDANVGESALPARGR
jgi:uncharacterized protein (DUF2461 family)